MRHLALIALLLSACGGSTPRAAPRADTPRPDYAEMFARSKANPRAPGNAIVTLAVFSPQPAPADLEAATEALRGVVEDAAGGGKDAPELVVVLQAADEKLPLNVAALAEGAGEHAAAIAAARSVAFVRYAAPPMPEARHLRAATQGAEALASTLAGVIIDLGTRRPAVPLAHPDWLAEQVTIEAERADDGTVLFATRGMAKLGLPDLERADVPAEQARDAFDAFQKTYAALRAHGYAKVGDEVDGVTLKACTRPPERYDHECVGM